MQRWYQFFKFMYASIVLKEPIVTIIIMTIFNEFKIEGTQIRRLNTAEADWPHILYQAQSLSDFAPQNWLISNPDKYKPLIIQIANAYLNGILGLNLRNSVYLVNIDGNSSPSRPLHINVACSIISIAAALKVYSKILAEYSCKDLSYQENYHENKSIIDVKEKASIDNISVAHNVNMLANQLFLLVDNKHNQQDVYENATNLMIALKHCIGNVLELSNVYPKDNILPHVADYFVKLHCEIGDVKKLSENIMQANADYRPIPL